MTVREYKVAIQFKSLFEILLMWCNHTILIFTPHIHLVKKISTIPKFEFKQLYPLII